VAWEPLGWKAAWYSQFDPEHNYKSGPDFASAVLAHRYPDVPNLGDMTKLGEKEEYRGSDIDILVGGTPCQSFSVNGFRKGLRDPRGALALAYCRIAQEKRPRWVVWENVPGVLSSNNGRDFGAFLGALGECGYRLAYRVLDARYYGVPQGRRRVFVVGHRGDHRAQHVLFDSEGGPWDAPPRQKVEPNPVAVKVLENLDVELTGDETAAHTLLASGTGRNISAETLLIDDVLGVRRLMPLEWERLLGFPDDHTQIPWGGKPAADCPDAPRYRALGNSIATPVLMWIGERIAMVDTLPDEHLTQQCDPDRFVRTLTDSELVERCVQGLRTLREIAPFLREARDRFAQPGRRVPVPGNPTWTEWVEANLNVTVRRVQQLLSEWPEPREIVSRGSKRGTRKLRTGDWRSLLKATERRTAQVFGSVEDPKRLAGTIRNFAQGIADRHARPGGKLVVSVSVKTPK
jgi:DNA (cytosine-5)-methyltransferase 1